MKTVTILKTIPVLVGLLIITALSPAQGFKMDQSTDTTMLDFVRLIEHRAPKPAANKAE
jgi:hypothetical protein